MDQLHLEEYRSLRDTIRARGGLRLAIVTAGLAAWGGLLVAVLAWLPNPIAGTVPLTVLVVVFEVNRMLHLGIERIGRYLQVFYEPDEAQAPLEPPAWERTMMRFGPTVSGAGGHPLLAPIFAFAAVVNALAVVLPGPTDLELIVLAVPHVAFIVWMLYADRGMRRQRARELKRFQELRRGQGGGPV